MITSSNSLSRGSGMPNQVHGALVRAPCPVPSCPAYEPNSGHFLPRAYQLKTARVERGRHCYAIKWNYFRIARHSGKTTRDGYNSDLRTILPHVCERRFRRPHTFRRGCILRKGCGLLVRRITRISTPPSDRRVLPAAPARNPQWLRQLPARPKPLRWSADPSAKARRVGSQ